MLDVRKFSPLAQLAICLAIDFVGMLTYLIPAVGESFDVVWAPISSALIYQLFGSKAALAGTLRNTYCSRDSYVSLNVQVSSKNCCQVLYMFVWFGFVLKK